MMTNGELEERLIQLLREAGVREDEFQRAYRQGQRRLLQKLSQKQLPPVRPAAATGFLFSFLEQAIRAGLSVIECTVTVTLDSVFWRAKR